MEEHHAFIIISVLWVIAGNTERDSAWFSLFSYALAGVFGILAVLAKLVV